MELNDSNDDIKKMILKQLKPSIITFGDELNLSVILGESCTEDCSINDKSTNTINNLSDSLKKPKSICTICNKVFPSRRYLNRHFSKHTDQFKCSRCNKAFSRKETQLKHIPRCKKNITRISSKKKKSTISNDDVCKYFCQECCKKFTRKQNYEEHLMAHKGIRVTCNICQKNLKSFKSYRRHQKIHEEKKIKISCQYCPAKFSLKSNLQRHYKSFQHEKGQIICKKCNRIVKTEKLRLEHENHETTVCNICSEIFCLETDLKNHLKVAHQNYLWFKCKQCSTTTPFMTRSIYNLREHTKKIHNFILRSSSCYQDGWYILLKN